MRSFISHSGTLVAIDRSNIDTDQIIPKQFLKTITREGLGMYLFDGWRYYDEGYPGKTMAQRQPNTEFPLNRLPQATILLTQENFGCGSSREHAVWSLLDYGIRVIIAPSFADIFYNNSIKNGLLPLTLQQNHVNTLLALHREQPDLPLDISLEHTRITAGLHEFHFTIDDASKKRLLLGLDDIDLTLQDSQAIIQFEQKHKTNNPWLFTDI